MFPQHEECEPGDRFKCMLTGINNFPWIPISEEDANDLSFYIYFKKKTFLQIFNLITRRLKNLIVGMLLLWKRDFYLIEGTF